MGVVTQILLIAFSVLSLIGIALFGHVPRLRNTPIGYSHRFLVYTFPRWLWRLDYFVTGGCICSSTKRCGIYLMEDKHPLVVIFYLALITVGLIMFIHDGWQHLSIGHKIGVPIISSLPYITMFLAINSDPGFITRENLDTALRTYPYDSIIFHSRTVCRTCLFVKPARSKHCSICKHCIAKQDHHCIWINNCVGHNNTRHFLAFLMATNIFLAYGAYLTRSIMNTHISKTYLKGRPVSILPWGPYFNLWGVILTMADETFIGAVFLLAFMCAILSYTFTAYHLYLIWAGTTTNETFKWSDWKDDIKYGEIYIADDTPELSYTYQIPPPPQQPLSDHAARQAGSLSDYEEEEPSASINWPIKKRQHLARIGNDQRGPESLPKEVKWRRVQSLNEIENIYDLGWKNNMKGILWPKKL